MNRVSYFEMSALDMSRAVTFWQKTFGWQFTKYEGMDYKQIGDVLKLSESATKSLLFRAYQTLREKLKDFI